MSQSPEMIVGDVMIYLVICFGHICSSLSHFYKRHFPNVANNIPCSYSFIYLSHPDVRPVLHNEGDIKEVFVKKVELINVPHHLSM